MNYSKKSYAKVNIFLKIVGLRGDYHLISSRFMRVKNLFDTIYFLPKENRKEEFEIKGKFSCDNKSNTIYKAYQQLLQKSDSQKLREFFKTHFVKVEKNIPEFAGLGGGSSNGATFLNMCNEFLNLNLSKDILTTIGASVGADVPFFIYEYDSANVSGIGEIVEKFEEDILEFVIITPDINSSTKEVYQKFRSSYTSTINQTLASSLLRKDSLKILKSYDRKTLNDLLNPSLDLNLKLKEYMKEGYFFSGSGSSFFKLKK